MTKKENCGIVISNKMNKTIVVAVKKQIAHKKYKKIINRTNKYHVHDELNQCKIGDLVQIQQTRPLSKHKRWKLIALMSKS